MGEQTGAGAVKGPKLYQFQSGVKHLNWKGGRTVTEHGYVLIRTPGHPMADVRGYVYEHRLAAEQKIGRPLLREEQVHHIDGNRQNNHPDNLEVEASIAHHRTKHRSGKHTLRFPDEPNPEIECACGCGAKFAKYDTSGRLRRYIPGHNLGHTETKDAITRALACKSLTRAEIAATVGKPMHPVATCLTKLVRKGLVVRVGRGRYSLPEPDGRIWDEMPQVNGG